MQPKLGRQHTLESHGIHHQLSHQLVQQLIHRETIQEGGENTPLPDALATGKGSGLLVIPDHELVKEVYHSLIICQIGLPEAALKWV